jgi:hypothetical protein
MPEKAMRENEIRQKKERENEKSLPLATDN